MSISRTFALSALGLLLVIGCSADKSGGGISEPGTSANNGGSGSTNNGVSKAGNANNASNAGSDNGTAGSNSSAGADNSSAGSNGTAGSDNGTAGNNNSTNGGSGSGSGSTGSGTSATGSTGNSGDPTGGTGSSGDPTGGTGSSGDPTGGTGSSGDPTGGTGSSGDPTGGTGATGDPTGGTGATGDPTGGTGATGDPTGGTGATGDPTGGTGATGDPTGGTGSTGDPTGGTGSTGDPVCVPAEMADINVIVFDNASPTGADSEGGMYVGGDLTTSGYSISGKTAANLTCSDYGLVVGGSVFGSVTVGGQYTDSTGTVVTYGGKAAYTGTASNLSAACGKSRSAPIDFTVLETKFVTYSDYFKNLSSTGTVTNSSGLTFTGTNTSLNVFNITATELTSVTSIKFDVPLASSVVVNVSGTTVNWKNVGFSLPDGSVCRGGTSTFCAHILWNFYDATTITLSGIGVQGTILAPYAEQSGAGGNVDGQVIVKSLTGGIEYHPYYFTGCLYL